MVSFAEPNKSYRYEAPCLDVFIYSQHSALVLRREIHEDETKDKINYYPLFSFSIMWVSGQFQMLKDGFCLSTKKIVFTTLVKLMKENPKQMSRHNGDLDYRYE